MRLQPRWDSSSWTNFSSGAEEAASALLGELGRGNHRPESSGLVAFGWMRYRSLHLFCSGISGGMEKDGFNRALLAASRTVAERANIPTVSRMDDTEYTPWVETLFKVGRMP